jgi:hypothetical protein
VPVMWTFLPVSKALLLKIIKIGNLCEVSRGRKRSYPKYNLKIF